MKSKALLELLSDGQVHSGEFLAAHLGVSRTAIWKQIRRAMDEGIEIATIRGRGYQLVSRVDLLDRDSVLQCLDPWRREALSLNVLDEVDSTNAEVIRQVAAGAGKMPVAIADCQTAGRGRRGRVWQSPRGENLYLSMGLTFHGGFGVLDGLSLVLGVAVANALEQLGVPEVGLKWPNDIFLPDGKLGGILVELQGELEEGVVQVIAGIGLNVHMSRPEGVDQPWSSLARACPEIVWSRNQIAGAIIDAVLDAVPIFSDLGFGDFREPWQRRDIFMGKPLQARGGDVEGVGCGIDDNGNYQIRTADGIVPVRAGEISLRVMQ
ncbi:biotin--[acetyl-CoA-carboxylase] ligase [Marinobacter sp. Arc7-DN-1]|uniref:biotin--[acetyl-CoA-carboxylase] ligase n=1 Tax=Marinobacter sp. Arc7-DN-1 TaxID=2304594 RepID=UPI000E448E87|nr:biotin--[acetyl-CoA-carboxylase] ligase [Marinobacter sp. Arc7-DN-1]AXS84310.1 biotin--[acetyl-CoA-carboxylase] ligase [Marinobacter sp. Arc7-DN-1]